MSRGQHLKVTTTYLAVHCKKRSGKPHTYLDLHGELAVFPNQFTVAARRRAARLTSLLRLRQRGGLRRHRRARAAL